MPKKSSDPETRHCAEKVAKKKGKCALPLHDCANCGATEGSLPGIIHHRSCGRCKATFYCSIGCQRDHWKFGGHKLKCVAPEKRKVNENLALDKGVKTGEEECAICLEPLSPASSLCTLPCAHTFHASCVKMLRDAGVNQTCPLCRAKLPSSPEKTFDDAANIYFPLERRVQQSNGDWRQLSRTEQLRMKEAVGLFKYAAEQGIAKAQYNLGVIYERGRGVQQSQKVAFEWYEKAAEQSFANAQYNLGVMYTNGRGTKQSLNRAFELYEKAASQGHEMAQFNLGVAFHNGRGVKQNIVEAVKYYEKAAMQGHPDAQYNLGVLYFQGIGVDQSNELALEWFQKAAEQGESLAQCNLGVIYRDGIGVSQSDSEAIRWFALAKAQGCLEAQSGIDEILKSRHRSNYTGESISCA